MPAPETSERLQDAVLWPKEGYDRYGRPVIGEPIEIKVRWIRQVTDVTSNLADPGAASKRTLISILGTAIVDREIKQGSSMFLGTLADWYGVGSAGQASEVMEVSDYIEVPDLKGRLFYRTIKLVRYRDELPTHS